MQTQETDFWAVIVEQLVERSLPKSVISSLNPAISRFDFTIKYQMY